MSQTNQLANVNLSDSELIEKIKSKLGGKELSDNLTGQILDVKHQVESSKEMVQNLIRYMYNTEKLSKEESKTVVSELLQVSLRTTERYIPDDLKDQKYVSNTAKQIQASKSLRHDTDTGTPGILNENGKYGTAAEIQMSEPTTTEEKTPTESLESQIKRLSKPIKEDVEITVLGRTFKITIKVDTVKRTVEPVYNEKELARILKSRP